MSDVLKRFKGLCSYRFFLLFFFSEILVPAGRGQSVERPELVSRWRGLNLSPLGQQTAWDSLILVSSLCRPGESCGDRRQKLEWLVMVTFVYDSAVSCAVVYIDYMK